jgi:hypothetical protein
VSLVAVIALDEKQRFQLFDMNLDPLTVYQLEMKTAFVREKIIGLALENRLVLEFDHHLVRDHFDFSWGTVNI